MTNGRPVSAITWPLRKCHQRSESTGDRDATRNTINSMSTGIRRWNPDDDFSEEEAVSGEVIDTYSVKGVNSCWISAGLTGLLNA